jgi:hypothetical protein
LAGGFTAALIYGAFLLGKAEPEVGLRPAEKSQAPTAFVSFPADREFLEGEPIEGQLTIVNDSDRQIEFLSIGPDPIQPIICGADLTFSEKGTELPSKSPPLGKNHVFAGRMPTISLPSGKKYEASIFLQRYCPQPTAGKHKLPYALKIDPFMIPAGERSRGPLISVEGTCEITIAPRDEAKLRKIYDALLKDLDIDDPRRGKEMARAIEALCVVEDPLVVSYLIEAFHNKHPPFHPYAQSFFDALARFRNDEKARAFMLERVSAGHEGTFTVQALDLLAEWKVELTGADVRRLLKSDDNNVWEATLRYIDKMRPKYNDVVINP